MTFGKEKDFAVPISPDLLIPGKPTDMGNITAQDFGYLTGIVETIFQIKHHWIPRICFIRFLVSKRRVVISPLTRSDAQPLVLLANSAMRD